jgi:hypothetical protein
VAPEIEISNVQFEAILKWRKDKQGKFFSRNVFVVDGEPIILTKGTWFPVDGVDVERRAVIKNKVICSDKLAQELEQAGIIELAEVVKTGSNAGLVKTGEI